MGGTAPPEAAGVLGDATLRGEWARPEPAGKPGGLLGRCQSLGPDAVPNRPRCLCQVVLHRPEALQLDERVLVLPPGQERRVYRGQGRCSLGRGVLSGQGCRRRH